MLHLVSTRFLRKVLILMSLATGLAANADPQSESESRDSTSAAPKCVVETKLINSQCAPIVCENEYAAGETWSFPIARGNLLKTCNEDGTVTKGPITCFPGYSPFAVPSIDYYSCRLDRPIFPICPEGTHPVGKHCVNDLETDCPAGQIQVGWKCIDIEIKCPAGQEKVNGQCVSKLENPECMPGTYWNGLKCVADIPDCPPGTFYQLGQCVNLDWTRWKCVEGKYWNGKECVPTGEF